MTLLHPKYRIYLYFLVLILTILIRYAFSIDHNFYFWSDSGHFALAIHNYTPAFDRPQLPGYFLHVYLAKLFYLFTGDEHTSLMWNAFLYSSLGAIVFYGLSLKWLNEKTAFLLTLVLITNPYFWFFGSVPEIYTFDVFFSVLMVLAGLSGGRWIYLLPIIIAVGTGFRQSSGVLLFPLYVYLWYRYYKSGTINWKKFIIFHILGVLCVLAWFLPMAESVGGVRDYINVWIEKRYVPKFSFLQNQSSFWGFAVYIIFPIFLALLIAIFKKKQTFQYDNDFDIKDFKKIMASWLILPLLFFGLYHCAKGYLLLATAGLILLLIPLLKKKIAGTAFLIILVFLQTAFYLFFPYSSINTEMTFLSQKRSESKLTIYINRLGSTMLMANSHVKARESYNRQIDSGMKHSALLMRKRIYFTMDPSCPVLIRELQPRYQDMDLASMLFKTKEAFIFSMGIDQELRFGHHQLIKSSVIIGSREFTAKYLDNNIDLIFVGDDIVFYIVKDNEIDSYLAKMKTYF